MLLQRDRINDGVNRAYSASKTAGSRHFYRSPDGFFLAGPPDAASGGVLSPLSDGSQRLLKIGLEIVQMLNADRKAHHGFRNAGLGQFFRAQLAMSR